MKRYILSTTKLNEYLTSAYGTPDQVLTTSSQLQSLQNNLQSGQIAVVVADGHAAIVTSTYTDPYVSGYLGNAWILPVDPE